MNASKDDLFLIKYKQVGLSDAVIAKKLGISEEELKQKWQALLSRLDNQSTTGYQALADAFQTMCQQYQLIGESLKTIAMALGNLADPTEVAQCLTDSKEQTLDNLTRSFIILRPFVPPNPAETLQQQQAEQGN